jgi:hypothetical protein
VLNILIRQLVAFLVVSVTLTVAAMEADAAQGLNAGSRGSRTFSAPPAWREGEEDYATVAMRYSMVDHILDRRSGRVVECGADPQNATGL